jgi:hypothetical protein
MTKAFEEAVEAARKLPDAQQDALAALMLAEIRDEEKWAEAFANSHEALEILAREARAEYRAGKTLPLDVD